MKVWRCDTWTLHADVREPFEDAPKAGVVRPTCVPVLPFLSFSPLSLGLREGTDSEHTFAHRWSPDGAYVVAPNAMNGPVFCAGVISRKDWSSPASLIGHPDIVQAAVRSFPSFPLSLTVLTVLPSPLFPHNRPTTPSSSSATIRNPLPRSITSVPSLRFALKGRCRSGSRTGTSRSSFWRTLWTGRCLI